MVATNFVESETTAGERQGYFPGNSLADDCQGRTRTTGVISKRHLATEEITLKITIKRKEKNFC